MIDIITSHCKEYDLAVGNKKISVASAPGRVHYLGENGLIGQRLLLSSSIDRTLTIAASPRTDGMFRFFSADSEERKRTTFVNLRPRREDRWANYIKTAVSIFVATPDPVVDPIPETGGLSFTIASSIPKNKGFGSSSALELASALALRPLFQPDMSDNELLARLAESHRAYFEREYDIVDFYLMMKAEEGRWTVVDESRMAKGLSCARNIAVPFAGYKTVVFDSRVPAFESAGEIEMRIEQLQKSLEILARRKSGVTFQDADAVELIENEKGMTEEMRRRCMHAAQEAVRLAALEEAMKTGDIPLIAKLFQHSQNSLRDLYEVSCPEIDWLVRRAGETPGIAASRMIGQGFGGSIFAILTDEAEKEYKAKLEDYERIFGFHPQRYEIKTDTGAKYIGLK
ncbi:MAG: galactokinase [Spirochaetaceae bacterium]|nr:galactokinase [Spirochaetaceae bacterium]